MEEKSSKHAKEFISDDFMEWEERDGASISFIKHCIAGSCAGIMEHMGLYPVDTLKVSSNLRFINSSRYFIYRLTYKHPVVI